MRTEYRLVEQPDQAGAPELDPWVGGAATSSPATANDRLWEEESPFVAPKRLAAEAPPERDLAEPAELDGPFEEEMQPSWAAESGEVAGEAQGQAGLAQVSLRVAELIELWDVAAALNERIRRTVVQALDQQTRPPAAPSGLPLVRPLAEEQLEEEGPEQVIEGLIQGNEIWSFGPPAAEVGEDAEDMEDAEEWLEEEEEEELAADELEVPRAADLSAERKRVQPEIILVAGANYPKFEKAGSVWKRVRKLSVGPWREFCLRVARERLKADPALKVTLFDFLLGTRENVTLDARQRAVTKVEVNLTAPIAEDYWNLVGIDLSQPERIIAQIPTATLEPADKSRLFKKAQVYYFDGATSFSQRNTIKLLDYLSAASKVATPAISITDVYAYITGFASGGKPGALRELHFFAHAFNLSRHASGGPILLNSLDNPLQADRVSFDKDGRGAKDFRKPTMDPAVFARAFSADAKSFVWGCNFQRGFVRQFVHQISKHRKILAAGRPMKISHNSDWGNAGEFRTRLGLASTASIKNVNVDAAKVEQVLQDVNQATYMKALATASRRPVVGAPPGTYADYDGDSSPLQLLHVPMTKDPFRAANVSFERALVYFRDNLKFHFDMSFGDHNGLGRGYITYDP